jgi:mono/diheme cytochrome c family protein
MLSVQHRMATEHSESSARRIARGVALLALAGLLGACDLVPQGGYAKIPYRERGNGVAVSNPSPPPVVPGLLAAGGAGAPKLPAGAPAGVTQAMADEGAKLFANPCSACHGPDAKGTPAAPSLADNQWINISGSYDEIVQTIHTGVPHPKEHPGSMPPLGGGSFNDEQVRQLAAYVFALSHQ